MKPNATHMRRRTHLFSLASMLTIPWLASCAHSGNQVSVRRPPSAPLTEFDLFLPATYTLGLPGEGAIARFKTPEFASLFEQLGTELLQHNGIAGRAFTTMKERAPGRYLIAFRPVGLDSWRGIINGLAYEISLLSPTDEVLMSWNYSTNLGAVVFDPGKWSDYETAVALLVLSSLNAVQGAGYAKLKFSTAETMAGWTRPLFWKI